MCKGGRGWMLAKNMKYNTRKMAGYESLHLYKHNTHGQNTDTEAER
jgi:hypothetical protein